MGVAAAIFRPRRQDHAAFKEAHGSKKTARERDGLRLAKK